MYSQATKEVFVKSAFDAQTKLVSGWTIKSITPTSGGFIVKLKMIL